MFCPGCGSEERQASQFCRACGTDLRMVRMGLERPDSITASAESAREEIGRAVAERIREMDDAHTMERFAHSVLPHVEKFLESPEEKRLRRLRAGTISALIALAIGFPSLWLLGAANKNEAEILFGAVCILSLITFAVGLGLLINGLLFSKARKGVQDNSDDARLQSLLDAGQMPAPVKFAGALRSQTTSNLVQPPESVTENTTLHLKSGR